MRIIGFIIFISIFLTIYGSVNYYIYISGSQALPPEPAWAITLYTAVFIILALAFITGRLLERIALSAFSDVLVWLGSFWLAAMLYFFLFALLFDFIRFADFILPWYPKIISENYQTVKQISLVTTIIIVIVTVGYGHYNARNMRIKTLDLKINKQCNGLKNLKIVTASDIHLGTIIGRKRFCAIVDKINGLNPDIVLFAGDIVDEDLKPVLKQNLGEALLKIKSRFGVYAVTGNHEFIGGVEKACTYLTEHRVNMLRDTCVLIDNTFYVAGREDISIKNFSEKNRKSLSEILQDVDHSLPVLLLDHQPFNLNQAVQYGIDLQLSGHTHNGQLWPLNYITQMVFELSWGYKQKNNTHIYVSCGTGTWGPPIRTGNHPEIVRINLSFADSRQINGE